MKKFLTLTIIAIIALIGLSVSVNAADMNASAFLEDMKDGKMSADVKLTEQVVVNEDMTFDLNGYTLTITEDANISVQKGQLTVKNGTVVAAGYAFRVEASEGKAVLNIQSDVEATAGACAVFIKKPGSVLNTEGDLTSTGGFATISGNGNLENGGVEVNITGGSVTHASESAVYFPNTTTLNISGGTITGTTAVYHKSGKLNISGGTLKATGAKAAYVHNNNGCDATGDALVIEASDYPGGVPEALITGGTFISENNKAVGYYQQSEEYKLANEKFIEGGFFTSDVAEYVATKCVINPSFEYEFDTFEVKLNTPYVTNGALTEEETGNIEIGVYEEVQEELERIFEQEINKNKALKDALEAGKSVNIHVQMEKVEEEDINEEELNAIKETAKDAKFVKFYDITLQVIANQTEKLDPISEISNKLTFKVLIPEELVKEGRTFFMYRYHDGEVEKLTGEVDEENYFTFESDKFSTYVLAYEDKAEETTTDGEDSTVQKPTGEEGSALQQPETGEKDETPTTGSVDALFEIAMVVVISLAGIVLVKKYTR